MELAAIDINSLATQIARFATLRSAVTEKFLTQFPMTPPITAASESISTMDMAIHAPLGSKHDALAQNLGAVEWAEIALNTGNAGAKESDCSG